MKLSDFLPKDSPLREMHREPERDELDLYDVKNPHQTIGRAWVELRDGHSRVVARLKKGGASRGKDV